MNNFMISFNNENFLVKAASRLDFDEKLMCIFSKKGVVVNNYADIELEVFHPNFNVWYTFDEDGLPEEGTIKVQVM